MRIYKWALETTDWQAVLIPIGAKLLDIQIQHNFAQLWALCDENAPKESRHIRIYGTGNPMPDEPGEYIATFQMHAGGLVFHAFEVGRELDQGYESLKKGAITMSLRLLGENPDTFSPECAEVMDRWRVELEKMLDGAEADEFPHIAKED